MRTAASYEKACGDCEFLVVVPNAELKNKIAAALFYDKRKSGGFRGRALERDIPELHLRYGDRLAPNHFLRDVGGFEEK